MIRFNRLFTGIGYSWKTGILVSFILIPQALQAQPFYFGNERPRESSAIMAGYTLVDFQFNGDNAPSILLNFDQPVYGISYSRSNFLASAAFGRQNAPDTTRRDLSMIDLSLSIWTEVFFSSQARTAKHRVFAPIMLFSNYRKVSPGTSGSLEEFNITTLGLGLGLGYYGDLSDNIILELRSTPSLGFAAQSFGESSGLAKSIDTDVQIHIGSVFGKLGLSLGYTFKVQVWDVRATSIFGNITQDLYDYKDSRHTISAGLNW